ncbi:hypothetical protein Taro_020451 [Colocasia esculenta]|uniref:RNase H type-1 domain-containing protein n=1 Tax=Colocasia esculenta TaxID=4460 RepID=A0A843V588_COLES|nr:hypothetical protein [Colocasia esculenta]
MPIPANFSSEPMIRSITGSIGPVLQIDQNTSKMIRADAVVACVQLDVSKSLPDRVWVRVGGEGVWKHIVYPSPPLFCTSCSRLGHSIKNCKQAASEKHDTTAQDAQEDHTQPSVTTKATIWSPIRTVTKAAPHAILQKEATATTYVHEASIATRRVHGSPTAELSTSDKEKPPQATLCQSSSGNENMNVMIPKVVRWLTPPQGRLKLNIEGAFNMMSDEAGGGGILRDHKGNMCCAFASPYQGLKSSLDAEALALRDGLLMCCRKGVHEVLVETDSLNLLQIVTRQLPHPWKLAFIFQEVASITKRIKTEITHVPREGNKVADCLAGFASFCVHFTTWDSWADLPTTVKDPYHLDKMHTFIFPTFEAIILLEELEIMLGLLKDKKGS